jgi:hypothetical protein
LITFGGLIDKRNTDTGQTKLPPKKKSNIFVHDLA